MYLFWIYKEKYIYNLSQFEVFDTEMRTYAHSSVKSICIYILYMYIYQTVLLQWAAPSFLKRRKLPDVTDIGICTPQTKHLFYGVLQWLISKKRPICMPWMYNIENPVMNTAILEAAGTRARWHGLHRGAQGWDADFWGGHDRRCLASFLLLSLFLLSS